MAKSCVAVLSLGVLVYRTVRAVNSGAVDAAGLPVFKAEATTSTAAMPDAAVIPPQARKALEGCARESGLFGAVYFVKDSDEHGALPEAPKAAKATK